MHRLRAFHRADEGQNLVEFALLLPILMYILMGIMQFGLIFAVYLTLNNAVREGARWGSVYVYDNNQTQAQNDTARNNGFLDRLVDARGVLVDEPDGQHDELRRRHDLVDRRHELRRGRGLPRPERDDAREVVRQR